jgi:hypothetical protein
MVHRFPAPLAVYALIDLIPQQYVSPRQERHRAIIGKKVDEVAGAIYEDLLFQNLIRHLMEATRCPTNSMK